MTNFKQETWRGQYGDDIKVDILRRYLTVEDKCPECTGGIRIAVGKNIADQDQLFRLECIACGWTSEALPDPEA